MSAAPTQPDTCPMCGSEKREVRELVQAASKMRGVEVPCPDAWHDTQESQPDTLDGDGAKATSAYYWCSRMIAACKPFDAPGKENPSAVAADIATRLATAEQRVREVEGALEALDAARALPWVEFVTDAVVTTSGIQQWQVYCTKHGDSAGGAPCYWCANEAEKHRSNQRREHEWAEQNALRLLERAVRVAARTETGATDE
jgi:hypothetical protein